jgi:hypothetical protein
LKIHLRQIFFYTLGMLPVQANPYLCHHPDGVEIWSLSALTMHYGPHSYHQHVSWEMFQPFGYEYYKNYDLFCKAILDCLDQTHTTHKAVSASLLTPKFQTFQNITFNP